MTSGDGHIPKLKNYSTSSFIAVIIILTTNHTTIWPQVNLRHISLEQGLPGASVKEIFQDQYGVMWIGIEPIGLCRYDGNEYTVFQNNPHDSISLSNNFISNIVEDKAGIIWVGTSEGLNSFNRKTGEFTRYLNIPGNQQSIPDNYIFTLFLDRDDFLWIGTRKGLSKFNTQKTEFVHLLGPDEYNGQNIEVTSITDDAAGNIYVGTRNKGLQRISAGSNSLNASEWNEKKIGQIEYRPEISRIYSDSNNNPDTAFSIGIRSLVLDANNNLYIGTNSGVYVLNTQTNYSEKISFTDLKVPLLDQALIEELIIDRNRQLWIGTAFNGVGIYHIDSKELTYVSSEDGNFSDLKGNELRAIYEDMYGLVWLGTKFQGIHLYDPRQTTFEIIRKNGANNGISDNYIMSLAEDSDNKIWIGTIVGGINIYDPKTGINKTVKHNPNDPYSIRSNRVEAICMHDEANVWLGTDVGLELFNKKTERAEHYGDMIVRTIVRKNEDELFVGSRDSGLYVFNVATKQFNRIKSKHLGLFGDTHHDIRRIITDELGRFWIATHYDGLYLYDEPKDSLVHFYKTKTRPDSISGNLIRSLCMDKEGNIWIGTKSDGLNKYVVDSNYFISFSEKDGLPSNTIYSIVEDRNGDLWLGSHHGLIKYSVEENIFDQYNELYGLHGRTFEINAYLKASDGTLYFGGSNGLNYFDPNTIYKKEYIAPMIISSFKRYDEVIDIDITQHKEYELNYKDNYISFSYSLLDYSEPRSNQYSYILENFDKQWIDAGNRTFASYTALPPGKYTFRVKGANIDDDWNEEGLSIDIIIPSPFWKKTWFIILMILLSGILILTIYFYRISVIRSNERRLQKLVQQKTSDLQVANTILEKQKAEIESHNITLVKQGEQIKNQNKELEAFAYSVSHDLRAPIRHISGFMQLLQKALQPMDAKIQSYFDKIMLASRGMSVMIDELLKFSRLGRTKINYRSIELSKIVNDTMEQFKPDYEGRKIQWTVNKLPQVNGDPALLKIVFENLISNAIKYTSGKEEARIEIGERNNETDSLACIYIKDNGAGFDMAYKDKLFGVFQRLHKSEEFEGIGIGLANVKQIIMKHGGTIDAEAEVNNGATFYISLPKSDYNYYE